MSEELEIPLLKELISKGEADVEGLNFSASEQSQIEVTLDTPDHSSHFVPEPVDLAELENDFESEDFNSVQELLIEEEVRMILDKHMENAYEEIIRLVHHHLIKK